MPADERNADAELDTNLSGLEIGQLTAKYLEALTSHPSKTQATRKGLQC
jgi:hypothetical protein